MAELPSIFQLPDQEFLSLIRRLDAAVGSGAAFIKGGPVWTSSLVIDDPEAAGFSGDEWRELGPLVRDIDPILYFAFGGVDDEYLADYLQDVFEIEEIEASTLSLARSRVEAIRRDMPNTESVWQARSASLLPVLNAIRHRIQRSSGDDEAPRVLLEITSASPGAQLPARERTATLLLELLPQDINYVRRALDKIAEEIEKQ